MLADMLHEPWHHGKFPRETSNNESSSVPDQSDGDKPKRPERRQIDFFYSDFFANERITLSQKNYSFIYAALKKQQEEHLQFRPKRHSKDGSLAGKEQMQQVHAEVPRGAIMVKTETTIERHHIAHMREPEELLRFQPKERVKEENSVCKEQVQQVHAEVPRGAIKVEREVTIEWDPLHET